MTGTSKTRGSFEVGIGGGGGGGELRICESDLLRLIHQNVQEFVKLKIHQRSPNKPNLFSCQTPKDLGGSVEYETQVRLR